ncbi:hypothetical protein VINE108521_05385 [Vibrio neonatus]
MGYNAAACGGATDCVIGMCIGCIGIFCAERTGGIRALRNMQIRDVISTMNGNSNFTRIGITRRISHSVLNGVCFRLTLRKMLSRVVIKRIGIGPIRHHIKVTMLAISIDDSDYIAHFAVRIHITRRGHFTIFSNGICGVWRSNMLINRHSQSI